MRCMVRNKTAFYYALYTGRNEITDEYGNATGQYSVTYGKPIKAYGNISPVQGIVQTQLFGANTKYDRVIVLDDVHIPIDEYSVLWVDTLPLIEADGSTSTPHNYEVTKVAPSLNGVAVAISKVMVR